MEFHTSVKCRNIAKKNKIKLFYAWPIQRILVNIADCWLEKIKRTNFVRSIWKYAHLSTPPNVLDPEKNGWTLIDNKYYPNWFDGEMSLPDILFIPSEDDIEADDIIYPSDSDEESDTDE